MYGSESWVWQKKHDSTISAVEMRALGSMIGVKLYKYTITFFRFCSYLAFLNLPVFAYGASIGWMSPMSLLLQSENSPRGEPLTDVEISWIASVSYLICIPANFILAFMVDSIGRKKTLIFVSLVTATSWIIMLSSLQTWALILARSLVGFTTGCYVTCPLYTKEISEDSIRGVLGSLVILFQTIGNLFLYVIGDYLSYHAIIMVCLAMPVLHILLFLLMPDSPSYLIKKGKNEEAEKALCWLWCRQANDSVIQTELNRIRNEQTKDTEKKQFALKSILKDPLLFRAFRIAMFVSIAREVCGAIPVLNYAGSIFHDASKGTGLILSPNQQAMMLGLVQVAGSSLASSVVEKAGRKPLLIVTSMVSGLSMFALAIWFLVRGFGYSPPGWVPITSLCLCIFCDSSGLQPVSVVVIGEMFSYTYRGTVMAISMSFASSAAFLQMLFFKLIVSSIGEYVAFFFFGIVCVTTAVYVIFFLPETKQRSLEEIQNDLKTKKEREMERKNIDDFM